MEYIGIKKKIKMYRHLQDLNLRSLLQLVSHCTIWSFSQQYRKKLMNRDSTLRRLVVDHGIIQADGLTSIALTTRPKCLESEISSLVYISNNLPKELHTSRPEFFNRNSPPSNRNPLNPILYLSIYNAINIFKIYSLHPQSSDR